MTAGEASAVTYGRGGLLEDDRSSQRAGAHIIRADLLTTARSGCKLNLRLVSPHLDQEPI